MKLVYDESYGTLSYAQRAAYRKHNISPADHDTLVAWFGDNAHKAITDEVKRQCADGQMFSFWKIFWKIGQP